MDLITYQMPRSAPRKTTTATRHQADETELHLLHRLHSSNSSRTATKVGGAGWNKLLMAPYAHSAPATDRPYRELEESSPVKRIADKVKMSPLAGVFRPSQDEDIEILNSIISKSRNGSLTESSAELSPQSTHKSVEIKEIESCSTTKSPSRAGNRLSVSTVVPTEYQGSYYGTPDYSEQRTPEIPISHEWNGPGTQIYWMPGSLPPVHQQPTMTSLTPISYHSQSPLSYDSQCILPVPGPNVYPYCQPNNFYDQSQGFSPNYQSLLHAQQQFSQHQMSQNGQSAPHHSFPRPYNNAPLAAHYLEHFTRLFGTSPTYLPSLHAIALTVGFPRSRLHNLDTIRKAQNYIKSRFVNIFDLVEAGFQGRAVDKKLIWKSPMELRAYSERERKVCPSEVGRGEGRGTEGEGNELWRWMLRKWY
jgi:hypothetical protein